MQKKLSEKNQEIDPEAHGEGAGEEECTLTKKQVRITVVGGGRLRNKSRQAERGHGLSWASHGGGAKRGKERIKFTLLKKRGGKGSPRMQKSGGREGDLFLMTLVGGVVRRGPPLKGGKPGMSYQGNFKGDEGANKRCLRGKRLRRGR